MTTNNGVNCFDGVDFTVYSPEKLNAPIVVNTDRQGTVWGIGLEGLFYVKNYVAYRYAVKGKPLFEHTRYMEFDVDGRIWILNDQKQVCYVSDHEFHSFEIKDENNHVIPVNRIFSARDGTVFFATGKGIYTLNKNNSIPLIYDALPPSTFYSVAEDKKGNIYMGGQGKIYICNGISLDSIRINPEARVLNLVIVDGNIFFSTNMTGFSVITENKEVDIAKLIGVESVFINDMYADERNGLFIATYGKGLYLLKDISVLVYNVINGLHNSTINCIKKSPSGNIYIGGFGGITIYDGAHFTPLKGINLKHDERVNDILFNKNSVWIATPYHIYRYDDGTRTVYRTGLDATSLSAGRDGYIYAGSYMEIFRFRPDTKFLTTEPNYESPVCNKRIYDLMVEDSSNAQFATIRGLVKITNGRMGNYTFNNRFTDMVYGLETDNSGNTWLATQFGLVRCDTQGRWRRYTVKDGLPDNYCSCLYYKGNILWVGTSRGLVSFDGKKFRRYDHDPYLPIEEINAIQEDNDRNLWIGTSNGLFKWNTKTYTSFTSPSAVVIKSISSFGKNVIGTDVRLPYVHNNVSFDYASPEYSIPELVVYEYRIIGEDSNWYQTANRSIRISSLHAGNYIFQIRSKYKDIGTASGIVSVPFTVLTPFYLEWWFILGCITVLVCSLVFFVQWRIRAIKKAEKQRSVRYTRLLILKQRAINALISPHFIFNSLNSIQHFINNADTLSANKYLSRFARLIRATMENSTRLYVTLAAEIKMLELYLSLEAIRLPNKLTYTIEVQDGIDQQALKIPSMLIQPYVENAVWHGISPKNSPGHIHVFISKVNDLLEISITDDGVGFEYGENKSTAAHKSWGLRINQQRLTIIEQLTRHKLQYSIKPVYDSDGWICGTRVVLSLPLKYEPHMG